MNSKTEINVETPETVYKSGKAPESNKSSASLEIPDIEIDDLPELYEMARQYVSDTRFGQFKSSKTWPLEIQVERDFKELYKPLRPLFEETDKARKGIYARALGLRTVTLIALFTALAFLWCVLNNLAPADSSDGINIDGLLKVENGIPLVVAVLVRFFRRSRIDALEKESSKFGASFNTELTRLRSKAEYALNNISNDRATEEGSGKRAEQWAFVALWLYQLHQYYDRYVTTASWRALTRLNVTTAVFRTIKSFAIVGFWAVLWHTTDWFADNIAMTVFAVVATMVLVYSAWDFWGKPGASNNLWAENFTEAISSTTGEEVLKNHMNTKISKIIGVIRDLQYQAATNS